MISYLCTMKNSTKTHQFLRVIMFLSQGRYYTPKQMSEELDIDLRTLYRYLDDLKNSPFFEFDTRGKNHRLSRSSIFWSSIINNLYLSDKEANELSQYLETIPQPSPVLRALRQKMRTAMQNYIEPLATDAENRLIENADRIEDAIEKKCMVLLRGYTSLNSNTKSDRLLEPFCFLGNKNDVRCYELSSQKNKTFKLSRCESVELLDVGWQFEKRHKKIFTDIFNFSDEKTTRVRLILGNLAKTILLEERPEAKSSIIPHSDGRWMLDAQYCSMKGVGRFYMGLFDDIEIVDSPEFKDYITELTARLNQAL